MKTNPFSGKTLFGLPVEGAELSVSQINRLGRIFMLGSVVFFLFFALATSGLLGPFNGDPQGWLVNAGPQEIGQSSTLE